MGISPLVIIEMTVANEGNFSSSLHLGPPGLAGGLSIAFRSRVTIRPNDEFVWNVLGVEEEDGNAFLLRKGPSRVFNDECGEDSFRFLEFID